MKLKFKNQDFQTEAVNTVANLFKGQEKVKIIKKELKKQGKI